MAILGKVRFVIEGGEIDPVSSAAVPSHSIPDLI